MSVSGGQSFDNARNCGAELRPTATGPGIVTPKYSKYLVAGCPPNTVEFTLIPDNEGEYAEAVDGFSHVAIDYPHSSWSTSLHLPFGQGYVHVINNTDTNLCSCWVNCFFSFRNPAGVYAKINWVSSGRYLSVTVNGAQYVYDTGQNSSSYGVAGYSGLPEGYYNSPPSPPYQTFPIYLTGTGGGMRFRVPFGRVTSYGSLQYGYLYIAINPSTGALSLISSGIYSGSSDPMYAQSQFQVTPAGLYKKGIGLGPYGPDLNNWVH